jgi:hypothetical protein
MLLLTRAAISLEAHRRLPWIERPVAELPEQRIAPVDPLAASAALGVRAAAELLEVLLLLAAKGY